MRVKFGENFIYLGLLKHNLKIIYKRSNKHTKHLYNFDPLQFYPSPDIFCSHQQASSRILLVYMSIHLGSCLMWSHLLVPRHRHFKHSSHIFYSIKTFFGLMLTYFILAAKWPQNMMLPSPCLTLVTMILCTAVYYSQTTKSLSHSATNLFLEVSKRHSWVVYI